jgi:hypothetical protein
MAVGPFRVLLSILGPEIPKHKVGALRSRKIGKPVDSAVLANPISGVHVVGMRLFREPRANGLLGGKEALLGLGYLVELVRGFFVGSRHTYSPNFIGGLCAILAYLAIG